jgi:hypothetical protein
MTMARLTSMTRVRTAAALALIVLGLAGACAAPGTSADGGSSAGAPATSGDTTSPSAPDSPLPTAGVITPPTASPGPVGSALPGDITLRGQVEAGVEPGCLIMQSGGKTYELYSVDRSVVRPGANLVLTGHVVTGMMSHCQQGQIFQVTSARPS